MNVTNRTVIHVYFSEMGSMLLKQDENYRWYEHLGEYTVFLILMKIYRFTLYHQKYFTGDAGGICSFFIGFSIISIVELLYFIALFLLEVCGISHATTEKEDSNKKIAVQPIYLNEYFPRPRIDARKYKGNNDRL